MFGTGHLMWLRMKKRAEPRAILDTPSPKTVLQKSTSMKSEMTIWRIPGATFWLGILGGGWSSPN